MNSRYVLVWFPMLFLILSQLTSQQVYGRHRHVEVFYAELEEMNDSGVHGRAILLKKGRFLKVLMIVKGYEAFRMHPQHIHGLVADGQPVGDATCPPPEADRNGNEIIELGEGLPFYGPPRVVLEPFPRPIKENGVVHYQQVFDLSDQPPLLSLDRHVIVLHGLTKTGDPVIDNPLPVACGEIYRLSRPGMN